MVLGFALVQALELVLAPSWASLLLRGTVSLLVLARVWVTLWAMKSAWPWALRSAMASEML